MKEKYNHIHFVGIGGIGVSSLARYYIPFSGSISGSDTNPCDDLKKEGIRIFQGHSAKNVPRETDFLIHSTAVLPDNPEIKKAKKKGVKVLSYPQALGEITQNYYTIAVSGTHGKGTTTAILALIMIESGLDPTVIIGTKLKEFGNTNFRKGKSKYLLIEADEFKAAFLNYHPKMAVVTNIEEDHLDYYKDINSILKTFKRYIRENLKKGTLVVNKDDKNCRTLKKEAVGKVAEYSLKDDIAREIKLPLPGKHNLSNALAAFRASKELRVGKKDALRAISGFKGTWRRFDEKEVILKSGVPIKIINDYAHHPTAIKVTLSAVKEKYPDKKIVAVFQPHQYERTYRLFSSFVKALLSADVDKLFIADIYTVEGRESKEIIKKVSSEDLCLKVKKASCTGGLDKTEKSLLKNLHGNEILVIMGAGDVYTLEERLVSKVTG